MNTDNMKMYFDYLEELRESGITNMFGAGPFIEDTFGVSPKEAQIILVSWMKSKEKGKQP